MTEPALRMDDSITLSQLLEGMADAPPLPISGIAADSRTVEPGDLFLACRGASAHGLKFVGEAVAAGAVAVAWDGDPSAPAPAGWPVPMFEVPALGDRLGEIANRFFDSPSRRLAVAGVTGTNGKTTVAWLLAQSLRRLGRACGYVGTLGAGVDEADMRQGLTTPPCIELHETLALIRAAGATHAALEVSSHGLAQNRVDGVRFDAALFTNLSRDHIDYHGDMRRYGETKASFVLRPEIPHHVVNIDDPYGLELARRCDGNLTAVSVTSPHTDEFDSYVRLGVVARDDAGTSVDAITTWGDAAFHLPLAGRFNVANAALVLGQLLRWGISLADAAAALRGVVPPPGRLQRVEGDPGTLPSVYVDYAHTPAGLEAVLQALRPHCEGELWCVFGCGGDRDRGKRRLMGETVGTLAEHAVVTSDNPRSESPDAIINEILTGMKADTVAIEDRAAAIAWAIDSARPDDVILLAGKGHETVQVIGERRIPFSDYDVARACLERRAGRGTDKR